MGRLLLLGSGRKRFFVGLNREAGVVGDRVSFGAEGESKLVLFGQVWAVRVA